MGREGWMLLRAYWPAAVLCGLGLLVTMPLSGLRDDPRTAGIFYVMRWLPVVMIVGAFALFCSTSYRLWRWCRGVGPTCVKCGGPLGFERDGRTDRGGTFRRCYACGNAVNHRHYE